MQHLRGIFLGAALFVVCGVAVQARPGVPLTPNGAFVGRDAYGAQTLTLVSRVALKPGKLVRSDIRVANAGISPAEKIVPLERVPAGTAYKAGSASTPAGTRVGFSTDRGRTWSEKPLVHVEMRSGARETAKAVNPASSAAYHYDVQIK